MQAGGQSLYFSFYVYKDWINLGIPPDLYHLPLYATEANGIYYWSGGHPERPDVHYEPGWVQETYAEINRYNQQAAVDGKPILHVDGYEVELENVSEILADPAEEADEAS